MSGKENVKQAMDMVEAVLSGILEANSLNGDGILEGAKKAIGDLDALKNKATLRTKEGTNLVFPVLEAAQNLEEAWEDARGGDDMDDVKWRLEGFIDTVAALNGALKDRTVIMT